MRCPGPFGILRASIHFPLAREDPPVPSGNCSEVRFNPLPSCEGRQISPVSGSIACSLQSTSLLRGKTLHPFCLSWAVKCFNPLPSCEGRQTATVRKKAMEMLQSTSLLRGKTNYHDIDERYNNSFNPLPSCEGRQQISPKNTCLHSMFLYISTIQFLIILTADTNFGVICLLFLHFNGANPF